RAQPPTQCGVGAARDGAHRRAAGRQPGAGSLRLLRLSRLARAVAQHSRFQPGCAGGLADRLDEDGNGYLQQVIDASNEVAHLIADLLRLSRLTRAELQRQRTDLSALACAIAGELAQSAPERVVTFAIAEDLVVQGDERT